MFLASQNRRSKFVRPFSIVLAVLTAATPLLAACSSEEPKLPDSALFELQPGEVYGPVQAPPISIHLGQSIVTAHGQVGPEDRPDGPPAIWEGHALSLEPDHERNRSLFFFVEGENLNRVSFQVNDQAPVEETSPGIYLSGELSMVRWAQDYSLRVWAETATGESASSAIFVSGEEARLEGAREEPLRMQMLRLGDSVMRAVRGVGYQGKLYRHYWPKCQDNCDLTTPGGALVAMIAGPADTLLLLMDQQFPYIAWGL
ncbi:MAG TPA: hypothetical protein VGK54_08040, partial [Chloroflexota bacterium]